MPDVIGTSLEMGDERCGRRDSDSGSWTLLNSPDDVAERADGSVWTNCPTRPVRAL